MHQLEVFAEEGLKLASIVQAFSKQLKDDDKFMVFLEINKLVPLCHLLQTIIKTPLQNQGASLTAQLVKNPSAMQLDSWVRKIHWIRDWLPTPVFLGFKTLWAESSVSKDW